MAIETGLPPRYEIRTLGPEHAEWAKAIMMHSNIFGSPVWIPLYPEGQTARLYAAFKAADYLVNHQINSGLSLGIFDTEYEFQRPESAASGGKLYWDLGDTSADSQTLLSQMDFPLVSVALAFDSINALDPVQLEPVVAALPKYGTAMHILEQKDMRDPASWQATGPGQVLFRNTTATRGGFEGKGFMKLMAQYMMRKSAAEGWRGIQIEAFHEAVHHVWAKPPAPFRGEVVSTLDTRTEQVENDKGEKEFIFRPAELVLSKVFVHLKG